MNKLFYSIIAASALAVLPAQAGITITTVGGAVFNGVASGLISGNDDQGGGSTGLTALGNLTSAGSFGGSGATWATGNGTGATNLTDLSSGGTSGQLTIDSALASSIAGNEFAISLKGGPNYKLFYFDGIADLTGATITFDTAAAGILNGGGNGPAGLSHASLYVSNLPVAGGPPPGGGNPAPGGGNEVPEPSTYAMFGMAFAMFAFMRYRARSRKS